MNISQPNENSKTTFDFSNVCREHIAECKIVPGFLKMKSLAPMGIFFGLAYWGKDIVFRFIIEY